MQIWLSENCLFLDPEIEKALTVSINCASSHASFIDAGEDSKLIMKNWDDIHKPETLIRSKIKLHPFKTPDDPKGKDS